MLLQMMLLLLLSEMTEAGHYLIWLPFCSKSVKIGVMEVGYELASRGHEVTVVSPFNNKKEVEGITEIVIQSEYEEFSARATEDMLESRDNTGVPVSAIVEISIVNNKNALTSPEVTKIIEQKHVDVVIVNPSFGNEAGYYVAHQKNASLVLFITTPFSFPWASSAVGDPINPSYIPILVTGYSQEMSFGQRVINTILTGVYTFIFRDLYSLPKVHSMLSNVFPEDDIPHINHLNTVHSSSDQPWQPIPR